ncbi:MAG TPA: ROK family protein [Vicinamibacterales bacterium]|nr:ROK family protein [Vicinamibacterales bacterium]
MRIGIDLGGTKIEAIALDATGRECFRHRVKTPRGDYAGTLDAVAALVARAEAVVGSSTVGVGMPGVVSPATGLVKNANSTWLNGRPLTEDLSARLGRPVRLANDANCFALSEATDGAAAGMPIVFGVILGTGVGGGLIVEGRVVTGANAIAGEWGHNPLPWPEHDEIPGPDCYCGRQGCIETFLSGPGLARDHAARTGCALEATAVVDAAAAGDAAARETIARYAHRLARGLASVINLFDPHAIVLGGGVSNITQLYERVPGLWGEFVFSDAVVTRLVRALHGDSSGVRGAAWLWNDAAGC